MKPIKKKILSYLLIISCTVAFCSFPIDSAYAKSKAVKVTSITLNNTGTTKVMSKKTSFSVSISVNPGAKLSGCKWTSSKKSVATVNSKGKIKAKKKGTAYITVRSKKKSKVKKKIKVIVGTPTTYVGLSVAPTYGLYPGKSFKMGGYAGPSSASYKAVGYYSTDSNVASVDSSGKVVGRNCGTAQIVAYAKDSSGASAVCTVTVTNAVYSNQANFIAHRGLSSQAPDNSLPAFKLAAQTAGVYGVEMDLWEGTWSAEDEEPYNKPLVLIQHNETTGKMCNLDSRVKDITWQTKNNYIIDAGANVASYPNQTIATIDEALKTVYENSAGAIPILEVKDYSMSETAIAYILDRVIEYGGENAKVVFASFDYNTAARCASVASQKGMLGTNVTCNYLVSNMKTCNVNSVISMMKAAGLTTISSNVNSLTADRIQQFHNAGIAVGCYTVGNVATAVDLIYNKHVDNMTSNYILFSN